MESLPPIPTPPAQRWREFRIQILPVLVFLAAVMAIAYLWRNYVQPVGLIGEAETNTVSITSTTEGTVSDLGIDRFDTVVKDQPLGHVETVSRALHEASLIVIAAENKLMKARMDLDKTRNQDSLARQRLDLQNEQVLLGLAQVRLKHAEAEYQRAGKLHQEKLITTGLPDNVTGGNFDVGRFSFGWEVAVRDRDALVAEVKEREIIIKQLEQDINQMERSGTTSVTATDPAIEDAIKALQNQLHLMQEPILLKAPMDGVVNMVYKRAGEKVVRGDVIATISAPYSARIVGYLRQPVGMVPTTNDTVVVRTRSQKRQIANAQILRVGAQMEPINPFLISTDANHVEYGLPILIKLPQGMQLVPGEVVDLSIQYAKR